MLSLFKVVYFSSAALGRFCIHAEKVVISVNQRLEFYQICELLEKNFKKDEDICKLVFELMDYKTPKLDMKES